MDLTNLARLYLLDKLERKMLTIKSEIKEQKLDGTYNVKFFLSIFLKGVVGYAEN